ncbi:MAG: hypothetical protein QM756_46205 [Polyangiaceae bacterium]
MPQRPTPKPAVPRKTTEPHHSGKAGNEPKEATPSEARFLLPLIPAELEISPLLSALLHLASFLDLSEEPAVDARDAGECLSRMGLYVQRLDDDSIESLADELDALLEHAKSAAWPSEAVEFIEAFLENCGFALEAAPAPKR